MRAAAAAAAAAAAVIAAEVTEAKAAAASEAHLRMPSTSVDAMPNRFQARVARARCRRGESTEDPQEVRGPCFLLARSKAQK